MRLRLLIPCLLGSLVSSLPIWVISGTVSPSLAGSGTVLTLSGTSSGTATADSSGNFSFTGLANGSYTVTPSKTGFTFNPASQPVTINGANPASVAFAATPVTSNCPCTVWSPATTPGTVDSGDGTAVEIGMKFRSDAAGFITGVRFYKSAANTGTHVGHLWTSAGALLGTVTFTGETASGWQQVNFPTGIAITANTTYIVSYSAPVGHYSDNGAFFTASVDNPPLHALANGTDGPNGVYIYSIGAFPNQTYNSTNYWVDPVFNWTATVQTWTISGTVSPSSAGSGTVLTLSGASNGTATADSSGNFSFSGLSNGSYTVTPSKTGFVFSPVSQPVTISNGNVTSINFTASSSGIAVGNGAVDAQGKASIDITFTSAGQAVSALQFDIGYPDQAFAFSVSSGSAANNSGKTIYTSDLQPGSKRILIAGLTASPRETGDVVSEGDTVDVGAIQVGRAGVGVAIRGQSLGAELVAQNPQDVRPRIRRRLRDMLPRPPAGPAAPCHEVRPPTQATRLPEKTGGSSLPPPHS